MQSRLRRFAWVALAVALVGEGGHRLLDHYGSALGHHVFHILLGGGAILLFVALALHDVHRHGRPRLSWRLGDGA